MLFNLLNSDFVYLLLKYKQIEPDSRSCNNIFFTKNVNLAIN
jgi:hypothetical protein